MTRRPVGAGLATAIGLLGLTAGAGATAVRYLPASVLPVTGDTWAVVSSFTDYGLAGYLVALLGFGAAIALAARPWRAAVAVATAALMTLHLSWLLPRFTADPPPPNDSPTVRVLSLNVRRGAAPAAAVVTAARSSDIVVLTELDPTTRDRLRAAGIDRQFPYERAGALPKTTTAGTTVLSRFPVTSTAALAPTLRNQNWLVEVEVPRLGPLTVVAVRPGRPRVGAEEWTREHELIRAAIPGDTPTVVAGDFNAVGSSQPMRRLAADGLRSAVDLAGAGWQPTYPAHHPRLPPLVDIDHILVSPDLTATDFSTVDVGGTDHLGVHATVSRR